jgi:glycerol uptake facilitator protein/aquaporin Z
MAVIIIVVGICLAVHRLAPLVPWVVGGLVGMGIAVLGTTSGGSLNPARQFGPAVVSGQTDFLWVYVLAPMVGALIATWARQMIQSRRSVLTHGLCGVLGPASAKLGDLTGGYFSVYTLLRRQRKP